MLMTAGKWQGDAATLSSRVTRLTCHRLASASHVDDGDDHPRTLASHMIEMHPGDSPNKL